MQRPGTGMDPCAAGYYVWSSSIMPPTEKRTGFRSCIFPFQPGKIQALKYLIFWKQSMAGDTISSIELPAKSLSIDENSP